MKFDMGEAWNTAVRLISANRDVVLIVAGVFFFLPYLVLMLMIPDAMANMQMQAGAGGDPDAMVEAMTSFYGTFWWAFLLVGLAQIVGTLGLIALLRDTSRPTVGEALKIGLGGLLTYIGAQILFVLIALLAFIPMGAAIGAGAGAVGALLGLVTFVAFLYLFTKFSLISPVIALDNIRNPIKVMGRSWALTKGNSVRIFLFFVLLFLAIMVVGLVLSMVTGLVFALLGGTGALIGNALFASLLNAVWAVVFLAVLAAIHLQLGGGTAAEVSETFE